MAQKEQDEYKKLAEAMLFAASRPLSPEELAQHMGVGSVGSVIRIADQLIADYAARDSALTIVKLGGKYSMTIKDSYSGRMGDLAGQPDITRGGLRVLAYIGKGEPIMQSAVVKAFGYSAYVYIKELVEKDFITAKRLGRTRKLETTMKFREYFGLTGK